MRRLNVPKMLSHVAKEWDNTGAKMAVAFLRAMQDMEKYGTSGLGIAEAHAEIPRNEASLRLELRPQRHVGSREVAVNATAEVLQALLVMLGRFPDGRFSLAHQGDALALRFWSHAPVLVRPRGRLEHP